MGTLPPDAEPLLAVRPEDFVEERAALARSLRADGRDAEAEAVASLKKPPAVVFAVNRAARDRPRAARDAADSAARLATAQLQGDRETYATAAGDLERSLDLLLEVALAQLSRGDRPATETARARVRSLLRAAVSDEPSRDLLVRGALPTEVESAGFGAFAGMPLPERKAGGGAKQQSGKKRRRANTRQQKRVLSARVREARSALRSAEKDLRAAQSRRDELAERLAALEEELRDL